VCTRCGKKFTDERWNARDDEWGLERPELCEPCEDQVDAEERDQVAVQWTAGDYTQAPEEKEAEEAEPKGRRLFGHFRS
jgi:hypothetical protein